jgi:predicted CopG family antitoxin
VKHESMSDLVTVKLRREVVEALKERGKKGETYSDVIERLMEARE